MNRYVVAWLVAVGLACVLRYFNPNFLLMFTVAAEKGRVGVAIPIGIIGFWVITLLATAILGYREIADVFARARAFKDSSGL